MGDVAGLTGRTLGDFTVRERLGEGGGGVVYRAEQRGLDREAVVKVLRARPADQHGVRMFLREAQLASRLDHPYAAHLYAFGAEPDGVLWIAMELVRGTTLAEVLAVQPGGRMPVARWTGLLDQICEVVHTAHEQGIVHRDLKPANIMVVARAGRLLPKLLDLGVAAVVVEPGDDDAQVGTPAYMAPEQRRGEQVDAAADIYALGVMTWEALTGQRPVGQPWPGDLPAALGDAVAAALAEDRAARPATALAFAAAVRAGAGLRLAAEALPRLDDALRAEIAWLPQPIAEAVAALDGARNPHQARDALWAIVAIAARWLGVVALAARRQVGAGPGGAADAPAVIEALRSLHRREFTDDEWLALASGLARGFARARDAYPLPELVDLALAEASPFAPLLALRADDADPDAASEEALRAWLAGAVPRLAPLVRALGFLTDYQLVVPRADGAEIWMGARPPRRPMMFVAAGLPAGEAVLVDLEGRPVLGLAPLVAIAAPAPGAPEELFLFAGPGRARGRGARLVAAPHGFERHDDAVWTWMRAHLFTPDDEDAARVDEAAPYRGLAAFTAADADRFFGRERQVEAFLNRLLVTPLLAVVGPSGAGKSSFVQAGVLPRLPAGWRAVVFRPGAAPMAAFAGHVPARAGAPLVIVIDQFEELFTLGADAAERAQFARALVAASGEEGVRVVITLRDDFLVRAGALEPLRDRLAQGIELCATPSVEDLHRIITEPARRAGYDFDDASVPDRMVRAVADQAGALALLSFAAAELWALRDRQFRRLTRKAYDAIGGVEGALAAHAEAVLAACTGEEQRLVRDAFRRLVTADGTRAVLTRAELDEVLGRTAASTAVIERLVQARLLVAAEADGGDTIEIIHEALIGAWPRLGQWRRDDAEGARLRDQLRAAARQWHERARPRGLLWRDDALDDYRRWRARWPDPLPAIDEAFATTSLADAARGRRVRRGLIGTAAAILIGATLALTLLYRASDRNAAVARDRLVASYVEQGRRWLVDGDYLRALPYLSAAYSEGEDSLALRFMLHRAMALANTPVFRGAGEARAAGPRADGAVLAIQSDGSAEVLDGATAKVRAALPVAAVDVDARGEVAGDGAIAAIPAQRALVLWDGVAIRTLPVVVNRVAFDPTSARLAAASATELSVWDVRTAARSWSVPLDGAVSQLAWSGDAVVIRHRDGRVWVAAPGHAAVDLGSARWIMAIGRGVVALADVDGVRLHGPDGAVRVLASPDAASVAITDDGAHLAIGSNGGVIQLVALATGQVEGTCVGHQGGVQLARFSPDGARLVSVGADQTLRVWDRAHHRELVRYIRFGGTPNDLRFAARGDAVVVAATDGSVRMFPIADPAARVVIDPGEALGIGHFVRGGAQIFANTASGASLWDAATGARIAHLAIASGDGAHLSEDGTTLALAPADAPGFELRAGLTGPVRVRGTTAAQLLWTAFDRSGQRVVTAGMEGALDVWTVTGAHVAALRGHAGTVFGAAFSPDGSRVVSAGYSDRTARVWDAATGRQLGVVHTDDSVVTAVFDRTGDRILTASEDRVARLWDAHNFALLASFAHDTVIRGAAISPDGTLVAGAASDGQITIWDAGAAEVIGELRHGDLVGSVDFAADGVRLVSAGADDRVVVWDVAASVADPAAIGAFVACHSPYRLRVTRLEIATPRSCD